MMAESIQIEFESSQEKIKSSCPLSSPNPLSEGPKILNSSAYASLIKIKESLKSTSQQFHRNQIVEKDLSMIEQLHLKNIEIMNLHEKINALQEEKKQIIIENQVFFKNLEKKKLERHKNIPKILNVWKQIEDNVQKIGDFKNHKKIDKYFKKIGLESQNLVKQGIFDVPLQNILKFTNSILIDLYSTGPQENIRETKSQKPNNFKYKDELSDLLDESKSLAKSIINQKESISKICKTVEDSVEKSKFYLDSLSSLDLSSNSLSLKDSYIKIF